MVNMGLRLAQPPTWRLPLLRATTPHKTMFAQAQQCRGLHRLPISVGMQRLWATVIRNELSTMPVLADIASPSQDPSPVRILLSKKHPESKIRSESWLDDKIKSLDRRNRAELASCRKKLERMEQATGRRMSGRRKFLEWIEKAEANATESHKQSTSRRKGAGDFGEEARVFSGVLFAAAVGTLYLINYM